MSLRRLVPLVVVATGLVALAAIASHGRPLSGGGRGAGPSASFYDYVVTSLLLVCVAIVLVAAWALLGLRDRRPRRRSRWSLFAWLAWFAADVLVVWLVVRSGALHRLHVATPAHVRAGSGGQAPPGSHHLVQHARPVHVQWDEIVVVLVLAAAVVVLLAAAARRRRPPGRLRSRPDEALSLALDESLDDLRNEPDLRKAIIAAYARMEHALARAGVPRRASEAPFEFVERALAGLGAGAEPAQRLTDLFEWAKFSPHEPGPEMRDEAIAALVAVRDGLRQPAGTPA